MRITINYFEGYPELESELSKLSPRARAERLRFLAATGLAFMRDSRLHTTAPPVSDQPVVSTQQPPQQVPESAASGTAKSITRNIFKQVEE